MLRAELLLTTLAFLTALTGPIAPIAQAHAQEPSVSETTRKVRIAITSPLIYSVFVSHASGVTSSEASRGARQNEKAMAVAALEDAAHYYQSGELAGVLPVALKSLRAIDPELARLEDPALLDVLVELAEEFVAALESEPRKRRP